MQLSFMINISLAQRVLKTLFVLLAFAITLKGINALRGRSKEKKKLRYDLTSPEGEAFLTST